MTVLVVGGIKKLNKSSVEPWLFGAAGQWLCAYRFRRCYKQQQAVVEISASQALSNIRYSDHSVVERVVFCEQVSILLPQGWSFKKPFLRSYPYRHRNALSKFHPLTFSDLVCALSINHETVILYIDRMRLSKSICLTQWYFEGVYELQLLIQSLIFCA